MLGQNERVDIGEKGSGIIEEGRQEAPLGALKEGMNGKALQISQATSEVLPAAAHYTNPSHVSSPFRPPANHLTVKWSIYLHCTAVFIDTFMFI